jgi:citrate lyase subunit beta/citryl-CoA lyase
MIKDAHIYRSDSVMFDLEDSVAVSEKDSARFLVFKSLKTLDYEGIETVVRINSLESGLGEEDIRAIVRAKPDIIRLPKTDTADDVKKAEILIAEEEKKCGYHDGAISIMAAIESPLGVLNALSIATSSKRLIAIALGAEDYVKSMKTSRSDNGTELLFARCQILNAARAAGIYAIDTVYSDLKNEEGFIREIKLIKQLGFDGKSIISPRQIDYVHRIFTPDEKEIESAKKIIKGIKEAEKNKSGVISVDGKMVDKPVVEQAQRILQLAKASGALKKGREGKK